VRVGRGGNIGRLRLRLEGGKDLRVDAEDVDLVVEVATECCTKKETEDEETGGLGRSMALVPWLTLKNFRLRILFKRPQGDLEVILNCGCLEITDDERQPHADHQFSHKKLTLGGGNDANPIPLENPGLRAVSVLSAGGNRRELHHPDEGMRHQRSHVSIHVGVFAAVISVFARSLERREGGRKRIEVRSSVHVDADWCSMVVLRGGVSVGRGGEFLHGAGLSVSSYCFGRLS